MQKVVKLFSLFPKISTLAIVGTFLYPFCKIISSCYLEEIDRDEIYIVKELGKKSKVAVSFFSEKRICAVTQEAAREDLKSNNILPNSEGQHEQDFRDDTAELVQRCVEGDEYAFTLIVNQYGGLLLRTAYLLLRDDEAAKDVVQESFILAWKNIGQLREPTFLRAWLLKIVVNQTTSLKRQLARKAALLREQFTQQYVDATIHNSDVQRGSMEDSLDLEQAIGQLPLNQRTVVVLFYYHRMTMPEIAQMLEVAENTLRKRLQSALDKIRRVLQENSAISKNTNLSDKNLNPGINIRRGGER